MPKRTDSEFQHRIEERINAFVADITALARQHALDTLAAALDSSAPSLFDDARRSNGKRSPEQIKRQSKELLDFIVDHPGKRAEEIADFVGISTKELSLPLKKLVAAEKIETEGQKRATRYFPAGAYSRGRSHSPTRRIRKPKAKAGKSKKSKS